MVQKRAAVIDDDVKRLQFVRRSLAAHEAASRRRTRFLRRSMAAHRASRRRVGLVFRAMVAAALLAVVLQSGAPPSDSARSARKAGGLLAFRA